MIGYTEPRSEGLLPPERALGSQVRAHERGPGLGASGPAAKGSARECGASRGGGQQGQPVVQDEPDEQIVG